MRRAQEPSSSAFPRAVRRRGARFAVALAAVIAVPGPAQALIWTRVEEVPTGNVYSLHYYGTTLYAGAANIVYVGASDGTIWTPTTSVNPTSAAIETVVPAGGALWAGTFDHGAYRSTDGGTSWDPVNAGLTGLGATDVVEFVEKSAHLYAATRGAGVFVLDLAVPTQWSSFNSGLPVSTAGSVQALVLHGTTLVAPAGPNGYVYRFPEGALAWQEVPIIPPIAPGLLPTDLIAAGSDLFVGANSVYRSDDDAQTWTFAGNGLVPGTAVFLASSGSIIFAGLDFSGNNHRLYRSTDRGDSWQQADEITGSLLFALEVAGVRLFAARSDGLWWTLAATTAAEPTSWGALKSGYKK